MYKYQNKRSLVLVLESNVKRMIFTKGFDTNRRPFSFDTEERTIGGVVTWVKYMVIAGYQQRSKI